jgi:hypothetical protein
VQREVRMQKNSWQRASVCTKLLFTRFHTVWIRQRKRNAKPKARIFAQQLNGSSRAVGFRSGAPGSRRASLGGSALYCLVGSCSVFRWASGLALRRSDDVAPVDCTTR